MTFEKLWSTVESLKTIRGIDTQEIGHSVDCRPIHAFHVGNYTGNQIIIIGAIHAREWITALLCVEMAKHYATEQIDGGVWFVPLVNPDGVKIALEDKPLWKANARCVDLNVNFDAKWGMGAQNVTVSAPENYIGPYPLSEPETCALVNFTRHVDPSAVIAYHSKGEVIYYAHDHSFELATVASTVTGYPVQKTVESYGGYSDWVSMVLLKPAITIEVGNDNLNHPIGVDQLELLVLQNIGLVFCLGKLFK